MSMELFTAKDFWGQLNSIWKVGKGVYNVGKTVHDLTKDKSEPKISQSQIVYGDNNTLNQHNK